MRDSNKEEEVQLHIKKSHFNNNKVKMHSNYVGDAYALNDIEEFGIKYDEKSNGSGGCVDYNKKKYDQRLMEESFKEWLKSHNLLEQFGYVFVKYGIYSLDMLRQKIGKKFKCRPTHRNVINHTGELYLASIAIAK